MLDGIRALDVNGDAASLDQALSVYLRDAPDLVAAICDAFVAGDAGALRAAAHPLMSSSANVGATRLARRCQHIELKAAESDLTGLAEEITALEHEMRLARDALETERARMTVS